MKRLRSPLALILAVGALLRLALAWWGHGFRYMDEHWQVMEPANFLVHGVWSRTVEWEQGLRCWIYPWFVSLQLRLGEMLGLREPIWLTAFVRSIHGLISLAAIPLVYHSLKKYGRWSWLATAFVAVWPFAVYSGVHTHGEMFGALFVLAGAVAPHLLGEKRGDFAAGACFGVALAVKIDVAVAGLGFGLWQVLNLKPKRAFQLALGVAPFVLAVGLTDYLTWGHWFQNVIGHAHANLVEEVGNQWGVSPWYMHHVHFFDMTGVIGVVGAIAAALNWRKLPEWVRATWFMNAFFIAVFSAIEHKEKRFMAPLIYTGVLAATASIAVAWPLFKKRTHQKALTAACALLLIAHFGSNVVTYWVKRPWWNRIWAMREAGRVPGIEKMLSPQWPAVYYLPRHVPSAVVGADRESLAQATRGLHRFSVAVDWTHVRDIEAHGFHCRAWPKPRPVTLDPVPWAYVCEN